MLAVRGSARHRLEHASDPDHQPIREAVGVSAAPDARTTPSTRAPADGRMSGVVISKTTPLVVGVDAPNAHVTPWRWAARLADAG
jgi:hypothetical protein